MSFEGWRIRPVATWRGGPPRLPHDQLPIGRTLPYRRAAGAGPSGPTELYTHVIECGWRAEFLVRSKIPAGPPTEPARLGDLLLSMATVRALTEAFPDERPVYRGDRGALMSRCELDLDIGETADGSTVSTDGGAVQRLEVRPVRPPRWVGWPEAPDRMTTVMPIWLDDTGNGVDVHAAMPSRYYLQIEQDLGIRLPADAGPVAPRYRSTVGSAEPGHTVFVATTSSPDGKDFGIDGFAAVARELAALSPRASRFTLLSNELDNGTRVGDGGLIEIVNGMDAAECVDLFASAELVVGNDTGLTHLAALSLRPDGTGPEVISLYNIFSPLAWTTASPRHHAVATRLSQQFALSDVNIYLNQSGEFVDPAAWADAGSMRTVPAEVVARFAAECAGWR
ncbi:glycosyltransferase family 9 protein [Stackebrandtia nassauensis]|uniref:Glycosyl transferase family 9 n=1 Tax=Stackebrandtia nassauensis (strain DSM 44728 / CIP 108903 / NRRL B-16338 / NBRC 102104 / LLR-40K-21) TaxID=446470 RepID=D3PU89_STANL|nr:glycosyltransferase family 9 protein [Stackebrandtia nassauensis]ADD41035.1 hypothetical protein Snas_1326 [Stackebrandtia nassauensis DSM 44728]